MIERRCRLRKGVAGCRRIIAAGRRRYSEAIFSTES
jgi:hypothetical protein